MSARPGQMSIAIREAQVGAPPSVARLDAAQHGVTGVALMKRAHRSFALSKAPRLGDVRSFSCGSPAGSIPPFNKTMLFQLITTSNGGEGVRQSSFFVCI